MSDHARTAILPRTATGTSTGAGRAFPGPRLPEQTVPPLRVPESLPTDEVGEVREPKLKRSLRDVVRLVAVLDALTILAGLSVAWPLRDALPFAEPVGSAGAVLVLAVVPILAAGWVAMLVAADAYSLRNFGAGAEEFRVVVKASVMLAFATATLCFLTSLPLSRGFLVLAFAVTTPALVLGRYSIRKWLHRRRREGELTHRVLYVGSRFGVADLARTLHREHYLGYRLVGCTLSDPGRYSAKQLPAPQVGSLVDVRATCERLEIDTVMVGGSDVDLRGIAWSLEGSAVDLIVVPHLADVSGPRMHMRPVAGLPLLHVEEPQAGRAAAWPKRLLDVAGAFAALAILAPIMAAVALAIKVNDRGPVLYRQYSGRTRRGPLHVLEVPLHAHGRGHARPASSASVTGSPRASSSSSDDPRVTRVGRVLRSFSLDELPQLFNVLQGKMSLVGPRPHMEVEVSTWSDVARKRLGVRPGMTGLWQVSGRSDLSWDDAVRLDLYYRDNWSMVGDLVIIAKTVRAVLARDGAY